MFPNLVRKAYAKPSHTDKGVSIPPDSNNITFRHPGYDDTCNILLLMPGLDPDGGIHHETARIACCILADNKWQGYFTEDKQGQNRVTTPMDGVLVKKSYYFHVPGDNKYAIVPTYGDWKFPHDDLPEYWSRCEIPRNPDHEVGHTGVGALLSRDVSCRITAHREGTENAHLVPASESSWFTQNQMATYVNTPFDPEPINHRRNRFLLRSDIHTLFDSRKFAVVPKNASPTSEKPSFVAHAFVGEVDSEVVQLYHNVALQSLSGIAVQFLFARFAWTLFGFLTVFLNRGVQRALRVRETDGVSYATKTFSDAQCMEKARQARSRSMSPKKRKPDIPEESQDDMEDELTDFEVERGRKRRRSSFSPSSYSSRDPESDHFYSHRTCGRFEIYKPLLRGYIGCGSTA